MTHSKLAQDEPKVAKLLIFPAGLEADISELAEQENRSFNNMVIHLLIEDCMRLKGNKKTKQEDRR